MIFGPGKSKYKGYRVRHSKHAIISLWAPEKNQSQQYHLEDHPRFILAEGARDWYIAAEPASVFEHEEELYQRVAPTPVAQQSKDGQAVVAGSSGGQQLVANCNSCQYRKDAVTFKAWYFDLQQYCIRLEGLVESLQNQFKGALSRTRDVTKLVLEELQTLLAAHTKIEKAIEDIAPKWFSFSKGMIIFLGVVAVFALMALSPDLQTLLATNGLAVIAVLAIVCIAGYLLVTKDFGRRKG
jgi:hypothetical protein